MTKEQIYQVAKNAHNVCCAFDLSNGIGSLGWGEIEEVSKKRVYEAVELLLNNDRTYAASVHDAWINKMIENGWSYGKVYNEEHKTHPDMIDYRSLSPLQRAKDKLFHQVVKIGYIEPIK